MQAIYEYTGIVEAVCDLQTFPSGFTKQDLVLTDDNDVQTKYPNHIAFTFKKDNTAKLNNVQKGQRAKVRFAIDGRRWEGPRGVQYFVDLTGLKIEVLNADGSSTEPVPTPAEPSFPDDPAAGDVDDMPF